MLRCWKKKRNPPLDRDLVCEGLFIKDYVCYVYYVNNVQADKHGSFPGAFPDTFESFRSGVAGKDGRY